MAIYNCEDTLSDAVNCILNQTYKEWELILYDDCSYDNTYKIACEIADEDPRIKVFRNCHNLSLAPTLNRCIEKASGEFYARMDGDDICDKTRFEKELRFLETHPEFAVVSSNMNLYDNDGIYGTVKYKRIPETIDFIHGSPICHAGCMIRASIMKELNGYNSSKEVERLEDYDLWIRLYKAGYKAYNIQEPLYSMREDRNAIKRKKFKFRLSEYRLKKKMIKGFNFPSKYTIYCYKPLALGLLPSPVYSILHKKKYNN